MNAPGDWSFAVLSDLHIGGYHLDYGRKGWRLHEERGYGEEYFLTERARRAVEWINEAAADPDCPVLFAAVLGDLTDSAEGCEFHKARDILDGLEVPWLPLLGNHDVWPSAGDEDAGGPLGVGYFQRMFAARLEAFGGSEVVEGWEVDGSEADGTPLMNYAFSVEGLHFAALDCVNRRPFPGLEGGASTVGVYRRSTRRWLESHLESWGMEPAVILSHHPLSGQIYRPRGMSDGDFDLLRLIAYISFTPEDHGLIAASLGRAENVVVNLAGHVHSLFESPLGSVIFDFNHLRYRPVEGVEVVITESLAAGSNLAEGKDFLRMVRVEGGGGLDWKGLRGGGMPALNPSVEERRLDDGDIELWPRAFTTRAVDYRWEWGGGRVTDWAPLDRSGSSPVAPCRMPPGSEGEELTLALRDRERPDFVERIGSGHGGG